MKPKVSTITLSTKLRGCVINLTNVGKYLEIDQDIIGLKYNFAELRMTKGTYSTTVYKKAKTKNTEKINKELFYNQVTIIVNIKGHHVNIKLFGNGTLHITGCKTLNDGVEATKTLYTKLVALNNKKDNILLTRDINGVLLDKDNLIYTYNGYRVIGYMRSVGEYIVNNKDYGIDKKTKMFISKKLETQRKRVLLNMDGEVIGHTKIELLKNKTKFYRRNVNVYYDIESDLIYYNNDEVIGKVVYSISEELITDIEGEEDVKEIEYDCNAFNEQSCEIKQEFTMESVDLDVNCINVYFNMGFEINRQRLYERLLKLGYICKYKPDSYSGIKFMYKIPKQQEGKNGYCRCSTKCTCMNATFLIFQSGNVIATGFRTMEKMSEVTQHFSEICESQREYIGKRMFANEHSNTQSDS